MIVLGDQTQRANRNESGKEDGKPETWKATTATKGTAAQAR
jgi:hypothetical protein